MQTEREGEKERQIVKEGYLLKERKGKKQGLIERPEVKYR
jgi:hypothetical protein